MIGSLYIHIPFCEKKCIYCDFFSVHYDEELSFKYITAVLRELELRKGLSEELKTVYIGGGTPTTVPTLVLVRLLRRIRDFFGVAADAEITIEANPGTIDRGKAEALSEAGVNRFSIGVQSFIDRELKLLGRVHSFEDVIRAVAAVRHAGIGNLSLDLIYGIPGQTIDGWAHNVGMALELSPEHISSYELTVEKETPLFASIASGEMQKPPEEAIIEMYYHSIDRFDAAGYGHYEISNFAKPGFECVHNLNYWNRGEYIGVGAGAHSFIGDRRIRNSGDIDGYIASLGNGVLPVEESVEISCEEAFREYIFLGLRKTEGLNIRDFSDKLGLDLSDASAELIEDGLLASDGRHLRLTRKGIVVSNTVITRMFGRLGL